MTEDVYQGFFEDPLSNNQQYQYSEPLQYQADYDLLSLGYQTPAGTQYTQMSSPFTGSTVNMSATAWYPPMPEYSPRSQERSPTPGLDLEPNFQTLQLDQISSSKDTEKRRQQNRNSQIAHRQRNKKMIEDLRQEVTEYSEYSQDMYQTLQSLRETTKALVSTLDHALSMHPPKRNDFTKERKHSNYSGMST